MSRFVFGYGSLMWNPGFPYKRAVVACLDGWSRSWCIKSTKYRGCASIPGAVLGLRRGGECKGILYELEDSTVEHSLSMLHSREMAEAGYQRELLPIAFAGGHVDAVTYVSPDQEAFSAKELEIAYRSAKGIAGPTKSYVDRTIDLLQELRIICPATLRILNDVGDRELLSPEMGPPKRATRDALSFPTTEHTVTLSDTTF